MRCPECKRRQHVDCDRGGCSCGCNPGRIAATRASAKQIDVRHETFIAARGTRRPVSPEGRQNQAEARRRAVLARLGDRVGTGTIAEWFGTDYKNISRWVRRGDIPAEHVFVSGRAGSSGSFVAVDRAALAPLAACVAMFGIHVHRTDAETQARRALWAAWAARDGYRYLHIGRDMTARWADMPIVADGWLIDAERIDAHVAALLDRQPVASGM